MTRVGSSEYVRAAFILQSIAGHLERHREETRERFLAAVSPPQRPAVAALLRRTDGPGVGLRAWLETLAGDRAVMPRALPPELIRVYLEEPRALPLHSCKGCGLAIPVAPDGTSEKVFFPRCPSCGGPTGW